MRRRSLYIWVRTDLDWSRMDEPTLFAHNRRKFHHDNGKIAKKIEKGMGAFKRVIASNFFEIRHEFSKIAKRNLEELSDRGVVAGILHEVDEIAKLADHDLVVPTDDDDLIHTALDEQIEPDGVADIYIWNCVKFRDLNIRPWAIRETIKDKSLIQSIQPIKTNNAAFSAGVLRGLIEKNKHVRHWEVGKELLHKQGLDYRYVDRTCSVIHRSPFNATSLIRFRHALKPERVEVLRTQIREGDIDIDALCDEHGVRWASCYLGEIRKVYDRLKFSEPKDRRDCR